MKRFGGVAVRNGNHVVSAAVALTLALAGCSSASSNVDDASATPAGSETSSSEQGARTAKAAEAFLAAVCPSRTAVNNLFVTATAAGGWRNMSKRDAAQYSQAAVAEIQTTARKLSESGWPDPIADDMPAVVDEYLATLRPLERIAQVSPQGRSGAWTDLQSQPRAAEERVRIELDLGSFDAEDNGCPLPPNVRPAQPNKNGGGASSNSSGQGSASWTMHWTSPSGNIACGYAPKGRDGRPVVACIVLDEQQLMRVRANGLVEGPFSADSNDRSQLTSSNARALSWGEVIQPPGFFCQMSLETGPGMACQENVFATGFTVKRGTYWSYPAFW